MSDSLSFENGDVQMNVLAPKSMTFLPSANFAWAPPARLRAQRGSAAKSIRRLIPQMIFEARLGAERERLDFRSFGSRGNVTADQVETRDLGAARIANGVAHRRWPIHRRRLRPSSGRRRQHHPLAGASAGEPCRCVAMVAQPREDRLRRPVQALETKSTEGQSDEARAGDELSRRLA